MPLTASASLTFYRGRESFPTRETYFSDVAAINRDAKVHSVRAFRVGDFFYATRLRPGSNVSGGPFYSGFPDLLGPGGKFVSAGVGFVGFRFDVGNGVQYGWARTRTDKNGTRENARITVMDYAFADPGEPIAAGQRTENEGVMRPPAEESLGALALGAVGLSAWRGSRKRKTEPELK